MLTSKFTTCLICILLLNFQLIVAQDEFEFLSENSLWAVAECPADPCIFFTNHYKIAGTTEIDNKTYHTLMKSEDSMATWTAYAYLRKDTATNKIYSHYDGSDKLIFDINASLNDTFYLKPPLGHIWGDSVLYVVSDIDSVLIDDTYRKRVSVDAYVYPFEYGPFYSDQWIDGIGSLTGPIPFFSDAVIGGGSVLLCFSENDVTKYVGSLYNSCYLKWSSVNDNNSVHSNQITVSPNPATSKIFIEMHSSQNETITVKVYSLDGKKLMQSTKTQIDIEHLHPGIYIIIVEVNNQLKLADRIIKN